MREVFFLNKYNNIIIIRGANEWTKSSDVIWLPPLLDIYKIRGAADALHQAHVRYPPRHCFILVSFIQTEQRKTQLIGAYM